MKVKFLTSFIFLVSICIFLIFYKGLNKSNIYSPDNIIEKKIPSFSVKQFYNNIKITSEEIFDDEKFYLMNIWASWCVPCREEHRFLLKFKKLDRLEIIGLNYKDKNKNAKTFLNELKDPYDLIIVDDDGTIAIEWGAYGVPETFLIYDKKIIKKIIGPLNDDLFFEIKDLIK